MSQPPSYPNSCDANLGTSILLELRSITCQIEVLLALCLLFFLKFQTLKKYFHLEKVLLQDTYQENDNN